VRDHSLKLNVNIITEEVRIESKVCLEMTYPCMVYPKH